MANRVVELCVGIEKDGQIIRHAEVSKLKGRTQKDLAELLEKNPDPAGLLDKILASNWAALEGVQLTIPVRTNATLADRDQLLFEIVRHQRGDVIDVQEICQDSSCKHKFMVKGVDLSAFEVTRVPDDAPRVTWDDTEIRGYTIESPELGFTASFRYPTGFDQKKISPLADKPIDAVWKLIELTCVAWKDPEHDVPKAARSGLPPNFLADVDYDILEFAEEAVAEAQPGVNSIIKIECPKCGNVYDSAVRALDFLLRGRKPGSNER